MSKDKTPVYFFMIELNDRPSEASFIPYNGNFDLTHIDYDLFEMTAEDPDDLDDFKEFEQDFRATDITAGEPGMAEVYLPPVSVDSDVPEVSPEADNVPAAAASAGNAPVEDRTGGSSKGEVYVTWDWLEAHGPSASDDSPPAAGGGAGGGGDITGPPVTPGGEVPAADEPEDPGERHGLPEGASASSEIEETVVEQPVDTFGWYKGPTMEIPVVQEPDSPFMFDSTLGRQESNAPRDVPIAPEVGAAAVEAVAELPGLPESPEPPVPAPEPKVFNRLYAEFARRNLAAEAPLPGEPADTLPTRNKALVPLPPPFPETPGRDAAELAARQQQVSVGPESSVPTSVLERILSGLRSMDADTMGQKDPTQKDVVRNVVVNVTPEEIAAAGGDPMAALGNKIARAQQEARERAAGQQPELPEGTDK